MAELHLWMQAWSDQGERILVRVESVDKVEGSTLAVVCTEADFRTFGAALYQILHRNEPVRMVQQVQGQRGFEAWHVIVRRYDQSDTSDLSSAYAALIINISERDRAKDVEQFDDILRKFINETNKYEGRFWKIRDEEKTPAVRRLMPKSLRKICFRDTTLPYEELLIALKNILLDKVTTQSAHKVKKMDTSAPVESGVAAETDGEETFEEGYGKHLNYLCQQCTREQGPKVDGTEERVPVEVYRDLEAAAKVKKRADRAGKGQWSKTGGKKGGKGQEKGGKGDTRVCWICGENRTRCDKLRLVELEQESERCRRRQRRHQ